jgi:hypothetical protein
LEIDFIFHQHALGIIPSVFFAKWYQRLPIALAHPRPNIPPPDLDLDLVRPPAEARFTAPQKPREPVFTVTFVGEVAATLTGPVLRDFIPNIPPDLDLDLDLVRPPAKARFIAPQVPDFTLTFVGEVVDGLAICVLWAFIIPNLPPDLDLVLLLRPPIEGGVNVEEVVSLLKSVVELSPSNPPYLCRLRVRLDIIII